MRQETFPLSQKELRRVTVISSCIKGDMACARAAGLLCLSVRQIKRLKKRMREDGEAALAHANRGRPSPRRLPDAVRQRIVQLSRGTYAGFNDHHLCEKLVEREGFSLSRETLRRLLRNNGLGSPRKRRAPAHRQRRVRSARLGELVQLAGSPPKPPPRGVPLRKISSASAASCMNAPSATTTSCSGKAAASKSPSRPGASASPVPKCRSTKPSMGGCRSTTATPAWSIQSS